MSPVFSFTVTVTVNKVFSNTLYQSLEPCGAKTCACGADSSPYGGGLARPDRGALRRSPPPVAETLKSLFLGRGGALPRVGMGVSRRQPPEAHRRPCGRLVGATAPGQGRHQTRPWLNGRCCPGTGKACRGDWRATSLEPSHPHD